MSRLVQSILGILLFLGAEGFLLFLLNAIILDFSAIMVNLFFVASQVGLVVLFLRLSPLWPKDAHVLWAVTSLFWGAGAAISLSLLIGAPITEVVEKLKWADYLFSIAGGYPEELSKGIGVLIILFSFRCLNRPWHGLATGMLVGTGFDVWENFGYAAQGALLDPNSDLLGIVTMWGIRSIFGPGLHMMFAGFTGFGLGIAMFSIRKSLWWRIAVSIGGLLFAFLTHFLWNLIINQSIYGIIFAVFAAYPAFIAITIISWRRARKYAGYITTAIPVYSPLPLPVQIPMQQLPVPTYVMTPAPPVPPQKHNS